MEGEYICEMRVKEKTNLLLMIAAWGSIVINDLIFFVAYYFTNNDIDALKVAITLAIALSFMGFLAIIRAVTVVGLSLGTIICTWLGFFALSSIGAYYLFDISTVGFVILIVFLILEIASIFLIINRYRIRDCFKINKSLKKVDNQ